MFGCCRRGNKSYQSAIKSNSKKPTVKPIEIFVSPRPPETPTSPITPMNPTDVIFEYQSDAREWIDTAELDGKKGKEKLVDLISQSLELKIKKNYTDKVPLNRKQITHFHSDKLPSMSITVYIKKLAEFINVSSSALIVMMIILKKIKKPINPLTVHRLVLTSLLLAHKQTDDHIYNNAMFANIGGVPTRELNKLERILFKALNRTLPMEASSFDEVLQELYFGKIEKYYNHEELTKVGYKKESPSSQFMTMYKLFKAQNLPVQEEERECELKSTNYNPSQNSV